MTGGAGEFPRGEFHVPVMADAVLKLLKLRPGEVAVDATLGGGGHARMLLEAISPDGLLIGIDRDARAIEEAGAALAASGGRSKLIRARMGELARVLSELGVGGVDAILADLGVSSHQLNEGGRGFSFMRDGPLDMRMDCGSGMTAADLISGSSAAELEEIIRVYGEERYSRRIASAIAGRRDIDTTAKLSAAINRAVPGRRNTRINPATRTFQALRIAVNDELGELKNFLDSAPGLLNPGGRLAVLSYHSLEDRLVKRRFRELAGSDGFDLLTKKAMRPGDEEIESNLRSRSAKLRAIRRAA
ncbi:MAG: 16S rRNA (cytosine(1402)-N(4))-methyltransferase RsmH [bacterium]